MNGIYILSSLVDDLPEILLSQKVLFHTKREFFPPFFPNFDSHLLSCIIFYRRLIDMLEDEGTAITFQPGGECTYLLWLHVSSLK